MITSHEQKKQLAYILERNRRHNDEVIKLWKTEASMSAGQYNSDTKTGPSSWPSNKPRASAMLRYGVNE